MAACLKGDTARFCVEPVLGWLDAFEKQQTVTVRYGEATRRRVVDGGTNGRWFWLQRLLAETYAASPVLAEPLQL